MTAVQQGPDSTLLARVLRQAKDVWSGLEYLEEHSSITVDGGWASLSDHGLAGQRQAWAVFERVRSFGGFVLSRDVPYRKQVFLEHAEVVASAIAQDDARSNFSTNNMSRFTSARASLSEMVQLLEELPKNEHGMRVVVPDTNILLRLVNDPPIPADHEMTWAPLLNGWWHILVVVAPQVVKELDRLKYTQRSKDVGRRAQTVIRNLKRINESPRSLPATPVEDKVQVELLLTEPPSGDAALFPWLDLSIPDHRILLSTLDAARRWPRDPLVLATNDLNLALLASYADVDTIALE